VASSTLQVMGHENKSSIKQVAKDLINEDGWKGFYRGFGPRFFSMSAWGTSMILTYEYLSKKLFLSGYYILFMCVCTCFYVYYLFVLSGLVQANIGIIVQLKLWYNELFN